jgi:hypothetical protein
MCLVVKTDISLAVARIDFVARKRTNLEFHGWLFQRGGKKFS